MRRVRSGSQDKAARAARPQIHANGYCPCWLTLRIPNGVSRRSFRGASRYERQRDARPTVTAIVTGPWIPIRVACNCGSRSWQGTPLLLYNPFFGELLAWLGHVLRISISISRLTALRWVTARLCAMRDVAGLSRSQTVIDRALALSISAESIIAARQ